jgi:hypothetical protein
MESDSTREDSATSLGSTDWGAQPDRASCEVKVRLGGYRCKGLHCGSCGCNSLGAVRAPLEKSTLGAVYW